uniref:Spermatogenesis associated serine rich 1 n=1 Tax=Oryctolagus cuniculus TaxID=9986 RepID=A0A5F9CF26_RABIT|nr:spermatogenesis-associated serine-rich protein 1 isoform X3 [Oryctolagus cuniculus]
MAGPGRSRLSGGSILHRGTRSLDAAGEEDPEARPGWARGGRGVPATAERVLAMEAPGGGGGGGGGDLLLALAAGLSAPPPGTWQFEDSMFPRGPHAESPPPQHVESYLQHRAGEGSRERDAGMAQDQRSYSANHGDFLESKAGCASTALSVRRANSSSSVGTGAGVSIHRVCAQLDIVANLDQTSSSSHSDHSEMSPTEGQKENHPEEFSLLKLQTKDGQRPEWTFYPRFSSNIHTYHVGKQCLFNGVFLGNRRSLSERTVDTCLGRKKYDIDSRNGIPKLTPGDNPYMSPEQSKDFHKAGSTLPPVNFSIVPYVKKFDTFIPLEPLPQSPNLPFWVKEKANNLRNEITEVEELNKWQPAVSLANSLFASGGLKNLPEIPEKLDECRKAGL